MDLCEAAAYGTPGQVAALAAAAADVDELDEGRTALWWAVFDRRPDNARVLVDAGADPNRPMMSGWSPARLAAAGATPDLFGAPERLTETEAAAVTEAARLAEAVGDVVYEGIGLACVAGIDVAEAARRLGARPTEPAEHDDVVGVTAVPGGVVVVQPWGFRPSEADVLERLSVGTVCYAFYANPKSGDQGASARDGAITGWDLFPGGDVPEDAQAGEVLLSYLHRYDAVAFSCAYTGLSPLDSRAVDGAPDVWVRLP